MPTDTRRCKQKIRRLDKIPAAALRPAASDRPPDPVAEASPETTTPAVAGNDLGDGRVPGTAAHALLQAEADRLSSVAPGTFLYGVLGPFFKTSLDAYSYVIFMQKLVQQMAAADPLEQMLVEQLGLTHYALGRAHVKAANATNAEVAKIFFSAAAKLQAEFRQSLLALKSYRGPTHPSGRATEPTKLPLATEARADTGSDGPALPFGDTELGSTPTNRLKEYLDELAAAHA